MTKRKTDEKRAIEWVDKDDQVSELPSRYSAYIAGIRSERRAMRKEIGEVLRALLKRREAVPFAGTECEGILLAMAALKVKEKSK